MPSQFPAHVIDASLSRFVASLAPIVGAMDVRHDLDNGVMEVERESDRRSWRITYDLLCQAEDTDNLAAHFARCLDAQQDVPYDVPVSVGPTLGLSVKF